MSKAPTSYWVITAIGLLWNAVGGFDFTATFLRLPFYVASFPPGMLAWLDSLPAYEIVFWAVGVWFSLIGSLLMLVRRRQAAMGFLISLLGAVASCLYQHLHPLAGTAGSMGGWIFSALILAIVGGLWWYCRRAELRGWLR